MTTKERIKLLIGAKNLSIAAFERKVGLSNGYISNFKGKLGVDKLDNILRVFPDLNRVWLLTGEGEMLKEVAGVNNTAVLSGDNNIGNEIIQGNNNYNTGNNNPDLAQENKHLKLMIVEKDKQLAEKDKHLAEKERLIEILMKKT